LALAVGGRTKAHKHSIHKPRVYLRLEEFTLYSHDGSHV
jgi:hypothetical protein